MEFGCYLLCDEIMSKISARPWYKIRRLPVLCDKSGILNRKDGRRLGARDEMRSLSTTMVDWSKEWRRRAYSYCISFFLFRAGLDEGNYAENASHHFADRAVSFVPDGLDYSTRLWPADDDSTCLSFLSFQFQLKIRRRRRRRRPCHSPISTRFFQMLLDARIDGPE